MPVVIVNWLDCVLIVGVTPTMVAVTFTEVATVPELICVCTSPCESLTADAAVNVMPPSVVSSVKLTVRPCTGPLALSSTLKTTVDSSGRLAEPVPFSAMLVGVAETYEMEPTVAAATVTVPVADRLWLPTVEVAVIRSVPLHPLAT